MISEDTLSGADGAFRVWPDASGTNAAPLLVCGQTVTNGAGSVTFLGGTDTDLFVEAVSNGTATLIYSYEGTGGAAGISCSASLKMTAWSVEFVHAEGEDEGVPMSHLPVFTPSDGIGKGEPVYDCPDSDLAFALSPTNAAGLRSAAVSYLGVSYALTETAPDSVAFTNGTVALELSGALLADTNVQEWVSASFTVPVLGITNAVYPCIETTAGSYVFENFRHGLIFSTGEPVATNRSASLNVVTESLSYETALVETAPGADIFAGGGLYVRLLTVSGQPCLSVTDGALLSNAVFSVWETAPQSYVYRNYSEPVPTDLPDLPVPDFAPWRLRIKGISDTSAISLVSVTTPVDSVSQISFTTVGGSLVSEQKFLLVPNRTFDAPVPEGYSKVEIDDATIRWQDVGAADVSAQVRLAMMSIPHASGKKAKPGAVVLQSLDWLTGNPLQGLDPENRIRQPLLAMGYSAVRDYKSSASKTFSEYIKGKQVWYSMSHGATQDGTPYKPFQGLKFRDGAIRASDLLLLDLNYKLVVADGCCSAQTVLTSEQDSRNVDTLLQSCQTFADAWGEDSAYMGWSWTMGPNSAQTWSSEFINNLRFDEDEGRGLTVTEAHNKFLEKYSDGSPTPARASRNMKIHGAIDNIIETRKASLQ
ncbi:MAG: hypothetical protein WC328_15610 [Kiritimatiellia bacterium]